MTTELHTAIGAALDAGLAVLPPMQDGSKRPIAKWKEYQSVAPTRQQVREWYGHAGYSGLGLLTGAVSGGLEMLELEGRAIADGLLADLLALAEGTGLGDLVSRIEAGYAETTPSGGLHWLYRTDRPVGNTKLARRPATVDELATTPDDKIKVLIETRGEGGYVVTAPSNGKVHPSGGRWTLTSGGFATITTITADERDALFDLCRTFDRMPVTPPRTSGPTGSDRPGDRYNARSDIQSETLDLLLRHGWTQVYSHGGVEYLRRPGKQDPGHSATLGYVGPGVLYVHSTSSEFEHGPHDPFGLYARLEHGGDFAAAARALEPSPVVRILGTAVPNAEPAANDGAPAEPHARPVFRSAASIAAPVDVDRVLVDGVLRPASLFVIGAAEGTAKTQIICELAIRAATAKGSLFGHYAIPAPLRVMVLDEENGEAELWRREGPILDVLRLERSALTGYYRASFAGMVLTEPASQEWLDTQVEAIRPDLLILDTGTSMVGEEWGTEMKAAMRYIRSLIVRYGCAVAVLVHLVKPSRDRRPNEPVHGSAISHVMGQWTRVADSVALIADLGAGRLRWEMRKKVQPSTLILVKRDGIFDVVSIGEARKPSSDDRVLRAIAAGGAGPDDIAAALDLGKRTVSDAIARLRRDGLIEPGYPYQLTDDGRGAIE